MESLLSIILRTDNPTERRQKAARTPTLSSKNKMQSIQVHKITGLTGHQTKRLLMYLRTSNAHTAATDAYISN